MGESAGSEVSRLGALQASLEQQIPQLYRELALYLQVLREVLPTSLDQACATLATQVHPRRYNRLPARVRRQLHTRLQRLLHGCCSLLTVEQLQSLASQMARERQNLALRALAGRVSEEEQDEEDEETCEPGDQEGADRESPAPAPAPAVSSLPQGSIQLNLAPPLSNPALAWTPIRPVPSPSERAAEGEPDDEIPPWVAAWIAEELSASAEGGSASESLWSDGQLPRDPVRLLHWLEGLEVALQRRLRNLSHGANMELMRAGLLPAVLPVRLMDSVLSGQIESHGAPPNLLRLPLLPHEAGRHLHAPLGVLLRTVDLEMEQPRLRTCRQRLLRRRQEILKMAESFQHLQHRLQVHNAERLWRHDSQLNPSEGI
ncbi:MAG: hypothetical protein RLZZ117_1489 [Cyanobacteriota bacterium]